MAWQHRLAALAICLLALASTAAAGSGCAAGSFTVHLLGQSVARTHDLARCLPSATVSINTDCDIAITAHTLGTSPYVAAMWSSDPASYKQYKPCPSSVTVTAADPAGVPAALKLAFDGYVYGFNADRTAALKPSIKQSPTILYFSIGVLEVYLLDVDVAVAHYAISAVSGDTSSFHAAGVAVTTGLSYEEGVDYLSAANAGQPCPAGRYGVLAGDIKLCPVCPAGTSGDGNGCTACSAGYASDRLGLSFSANSGAGCDAETNKCAAGYYAPPGSSHCLPCPIHTYSATGAGACTPCPADTYAWVPGSTACLRCVKGLPKLASEVQSTDVASPAGAILSFSSDWQLGTCAVHTSGYRIPAYETCTSWKTATPSLRLALEVAGDCSITIKPITDTSCADPGAVAGQTKPAPLTGTYDYTYSDLQIRAYYATKTSIRTLLPTATDGASSFMLNIDGKISSKVDLAFFAATSKPGESTTPGSLTCTQTAWVEGGIVAGTLAPMLVYCGYGSYSVSSSLDEGSCYACPQGHVCDGFNKQACPADTANPYLGQSRNACTNCTDVASLAGSAYCGVSSAADVSPSPSPSASPSPSPSPSPAPAGGGSCTPASFDMELVDAHADLAGHEVAKCLPSIRARIGADCSAIIDAPAADNAYLPSLWSSDAASYQQWKLCPTTSGQAVLASDAPTSILLALNGYAYGFSRPATGAPTPLKPSGIYAVTYTAKGVLTLTIGGKALVYAVRAVSEASQLTTDVHANLVVADGTGLTEGSHYRDADNAGLPCPAGHYGVLAGDIKLCPLCPVGTSGDGNGCTACSAGYAYGRVGLSSDANSGAGCDATANKCTPGTFAQDGSSNCLPCPMHTYSAASGAKECTSCGTGTYAWIPGSTACLRCVKGVPKLASEVQATDAASPGSHILSFGAALGSCAASDATGGYRIPAYETCASWKAAAGAPALKLALEVAGDCSITIKPITDTSCADPGAVAGQTKLLPLATTEQYFYTYNDLLIRAYYTTKTSIRTLLPATKGGASSFMLSIDHKAPAQTTDPDNTVTLSFWRATNKPDNAGALAGTQTCAQDATVAGGSVATTATIAATCPAGSYAVPNQHCLPCPPGAVCTGGTKTACAAARASPYLGAASGTCLDCTPGASNYTSLAGAAFCTLPYFDRKCKDDVSAGGTTLKYSEGGFEWDETEHKCVQCRPGTFRAKTDLATVLDCQECPVGTYSAAGAAGCTPCPAGQYNPSTGMADQATAAAPDVHCLRCPTGSIALVADAEGNANATSFNEQALPQAATTCDACPPGTWGDKAATEKVPTGAQGCSLCATGTYRSGDASAENNVCKKIPAGYKAKSDGVLDTSSTTRGAFDIEVCAKGTVAAWKGATRAPAKATECAACLHNTYAPRTGMAACLACKGGWHPETSKNADGSPKFSAGHDYCTQCSAGSFRSYFSTDVDCTTCPAGSEVGPSGRQACTECQAGSYKTTGAGSDYCTECPVNFYMASPGSTAACTPCDKGHETQDRGSTECTPCGVGYFNPKQADATLTGPACIEAPAGTYVNATGASVATPCPVGTANADTAQDSCEPCAPGQFANTAGNKACKTCSAGTYSGPQAATCKNCAAGYYAPAGAGACSPCKPGTYASVARSATCTLCPKGSQCATPATVSPKPCPAGTYAPRDGSTLCTPCPVNFISTTTGQTRCTACAAGTNTRGLTGQKVCTAVRVNNLRRSNL